MRRLILPFLIALLAPVKVFCAVYGYMDNEGVYHMTNVQPPYNTVYRTLVRDGAAPSAPTSTAVGGAYDELINRYSQANGLDPCLVKAVMIVESNGNPRAVSRKGARGLMQIMPDTAQLLDLHDPFDPGENIKAGTRYLKSLYDFFKGDVELVLAAYNAGPRKVIKSNWAVPRISETIDYVKRVKKYYGRLKN